MEEPLPPAVTVLFTKVSLLITTLFTDIEVNAIAPPFSAAVLFWNVVLVIRKVEIIPVTYIAPPVFPVLLVNVAL